ncbi:MAG: hypothetical protein JO043_06440 [Candidatus Eremiobacteraeota bacterium]|nr:hypothetical protein [Candidatus Eremiobacteraeota bacterium]
MRAALILEVLLVAALSTPVQGAPAARCGGLDAEAILVKARQSFHASPEPPYVVYTFSRKEYLDLSPQFEMTYQERVWYRSRDGAALARKTAGGHAYGALEFREQRFDAPMDPGPPTADIFEPAVSGQLRTSDAESEPASHLPLIGSVRTHAELDYRAELGDCSGTTAHLRLQPRREPDRNRLRELWVDPSTGAIQRFVATDRLYRGVSDLWDLDMFSGSMGTVDGVPVIATLHAEADTPEGRESGDYRFYDVAFPATLPGWYFEPRTYGFHRADAPSA